MAKGTAKSSGLLVMAMGVALSLASCSQRARKIELQPDSPRGGQTPKIGIPANPETPTEEEDAIIEAKVDFTNTQYAIPDSADWTYRYSFLAKEGSGSLLLRSKKASVELKGLTIGQPGNLRFDVYDEQNAPRLSGELQNITLRAGRQAMNLGLKEVDPKAPDSGNSGGGSDADLELNISINSASGQQGGGQGTRITFTDIAASVTQYCSGSACHSTFHSEQYWTSAKAHVKDLLDKGTMPKEPVKSQVPADVKAKWLQWLSQ